MGQKGARFILQSPHCLVACIIIGGVLKLLRRLDFALSVVETCKVFWLRYGSIRCWGTLILLR